MSTSSNSGATSGRSVRTGAGIAVNTAWVMARAFVPWNGGAPASISYVTTPRDQTSERASTASPAACSGDMYAAVPTVSPAAVSCVAVLPVSTLAIPKSRTLACPLFVRMTLDGLRSR